MDSLKFIVELASLPAVTFLAILAIVYYAAPHFSLSLQRATKLLATRFQRKTSIKSEKAAVVEPNIAVSKELDFPSDWWTSPRLYDLEKRAIFSKTWLHICHSSLLPKPGSYRTFTIADFNFIVIRGKDDILRAFHNVCRHRAYSVCTKAAGTSLSLRCKYHGWTYDSRGKLVKAPKFDDVAGFDKGQNGLYEIRTFVDTSGFVYANFNVYGSDGLTIRVGMPIKAKLRLLESWSAEAKFNWKFGITPGAFDLKSLANTRRLAQLFNSASAMVEHWAWPAEFELSPLTRMIRTGYGDLWLTITIVPVSEAQSVVHCALYTSSELRSQEKLLSLLKKEVCSCISRLEGVFVDIAENGEIAETGSQEPLLAEIRAHSRLERLVRKEVFPASRLQESSDACKVADDLCKELETDESDKSPVDRLAW